MTYLVGTSHKPDPQAEADFLQKLVPWMDCLAANATARQRIVVDRYQRLLLRRLHHLRTIGKEDDPPRVFSAH